MAFASAALVAYQTASTGGRNPHKPSAVNSGLVGVSTNPNNNSYHHSKNSAPFKNTGAYTNRWPKDLVANYPSINKDAVTGSDRSMSRADMIKDWNDHLAVFNDPSDPRRGHIAEYIGTPDGVNAKRMDFMAGTIKAASIDHTWHAHEGWLYLFWGSELAGERSLSINRGETKAQYIDRVGGTTEEDDEDMKPILGKITSNATVWKGYGIPGSLMAIHSPRAYGDIKNSLGATELHYGAPHAGDAQALVDVLGTLPLTVVDDGNGGTRWETGDENNNRSVAAVNDAG